MREFESEITHHLERIAERAGHKFDADVFGELHAAFQAAEDRIARLEATVRRLKDVSDRVEHLERHIRPEIV